MYTKLKESLAKELQNIKEGGFLKMRESSSPRRGQILRCGMARRS